MIVRISKSDATGFGVGSAWDDILMVWSVRDG